MIEYAPWASMGILVGIVFWYSVRARQVADRVERTQDAIGKAMQRIAEQKAETPAVEAPPKPTRKIIVED